MKTKKFASISILVFLIFSAFILTNSLYAENSSNPGQEGKLRGISLTGDPIALHKVLIGFKSPPGIMEEAFVLGRGGAIKYTYHLVPAIAATIPEAAIEALLKNPQVTSIELDGMIKAIDAELDNTWGVKHIGAGTVHAGNNKGTGVRVAIIDSGIDYNHSDLNDNYSGGWDFVENDDDPMDDYGHGTRVAGTVAAEDNDAGVVGVAPEADLYALKVLDASGNGYWSDIIAALEWAVNNEIKITNNSYTDSQDMDDTVPDPGIVQAAFDNSAAAGILHVAGAGNSGNFFGTGDNVGFPARFESVIAVAATDSSDKRAFFSSTGPDVELSAPGVSINSTELGGGYVIKNGTSMASPHVAGTAALVIAAGINDDNGDGCINDDVRSRLNVTAYDLGDTGRDSKYGYGLVDADEAADIGDQPPVVSIVDPVEDQVVSGTHRVLVNAIDDNSVTLVELSIDGEAYFDITISFDGTYYYYDWDTTICSEGNHTLRAQATDDADQSTESATVSVTVDNSNDPPVADAGPDQTAAVDELVTFDGSGSYDPDGNIVSYDWNFGDGTTGSGEITTHAYLSTGDYTVTLTVTDNGGRTAEDGATVTVTEEPTLVMYVASIDMALSTRTAGKNKFTKALATVTIFDASNNLVEGATVYGSWSGATSDSDSGVTDTNGNVTLESDSVKNPSNGTTFTFAVDDVVKSTGTYDPSSNIENSDLIEIVEP